MQRNNSLQENFINDPALGAVGSGASRRGESSQRQTRPRRDSEGPRAGQKTGAQRPKPKHREKSGYNIISFFRDYRTHLAVGLVLCTVAVLMAAAAISFMFNYSVDQSVTHYRHVNEVIASGDKVVNVGGVLGARVAEWMMVDSFGISSFIIVIYLFVLGLACMGVRRCHFFSFTFRCLFSLAAISVICGMFSLNRADSFPLGGYHGEYINRIVMSYADALGVFGLSVLLAGLLVAVFLNPIKSFFKTLSALLARMKPKPKPAESDYSLDETEETVAGIETFNPETDESAEEKADEETGEVVATDPGLGIPKEHERFVPALDVFDDPELENMGDKSYAVAAEVVEPAVQPDVESKAKTVILGENTDGPEMVVVNNGLGTDKVTSEPEHRVIHDGDHIGVDEAYDVRASHSRYEFPPLDLLTERPKTFEINESEQAANKELIVNALRSYNIEIVKIEATIGPTVTLYEIVPESGTRISKIKALEDDIAMNLAALGIRIIAPIPGKGTIGIEVPNKKRQIVSMRAILESNKFRDTKMRLPMALGATISNDIFMADLTKMPHLLVAGATGQGKSVGLNCIITSLLYSKHPDELKFVLIDPKSVEFSLYNAIDKQYLAKLPDENEAVITDPFKVVDTLNSLCEEMEQRYQLLKMTGVRVVEDYNERFTNRELNPELGHRYLPYIVIIVDEYADLITVAGKEIHTPICRIAQKARAVGLHLILATQRPSADVVTGLIKNNFPARIAFKVTQGIDSKTILDRSGAQRLTGMGDMLVMINGVVERVQCALVETKEVESICEFIGGQQGFVSCYELPEPKQEEGAGDIQGCDVKITPEFRECAMFIASQDTASITSMQRNFSLGFNKAGRYMDQMQRLGIVGPANGAKPRQVLMSPDQVARLLE